jgi:hypothetical protein
MKRLIENNPAATLGSVNGMGDVSLPTDTTIGSGDVPGGSIETDEDKKKKKKKKKLNKISLQVAEPIEEKEVYIPVTKMGDAASLVNIIATELKKNDRKLFQMLMDDLMVSYNGTVSPASLMNISKHLKVPVKKLKTEIDDIVEDNIELLESIIETHIMDILLNEGEELNEGIVGRAIGALGGLAFGPKLGRLVAKVLGIEKGPLYNLLTSKVVGAALAQELSKNLI